ncbi:MAG: drug/metabolite transporter (DMT)-like permease [Cellvibrionaceae bacterium]
MLAFKNMTQNETKISGSASILNNTPLAIGILLLFDSMHLIWARSLNHSLHPIAASFWVLGFATVEIAIFLIATRQADLTVFKENFRFFITIGLLVAIATSMNYTAVHYVDAGTASMLSRSSTIFAIAFGVIWLKDRLTLLQWIGAIIALGGVLIISFQPVRSFQIGALLVLGSAFAYALHAAIVKKYGGEIDFANFMLFRVGTIAFVLFLFLIGVPIVSAEPIHFLPNGFEWIALLIVATVDVVFSRVFFYWSLRKIELSFHSIFLVLAPVVTILWSYLFFGETPNLQTYIGGAIVILGIFVVNWERIRLRIQG